MKSTCVNTDGSFLCTCNRGFTSNMTGCQGMLNARYNTVIHLRSELIDENFTENKILKCIRTALKSIVFVCSQ